MQVQMRLLGVMTSEDGQDLPGHPHITEMTFDFGKLFDVILNDETMRRRLEVPITKKVLIKTFMENTGKLFNMAANIQLGQLTLQSLADLLERTGSFGSVMVDENAPPEIMETLRKAGGVKKVPAVPAGTVH